MSCRERFRNPVHQDLYAPDSKVRARTESSDRDSQVLREVVAVLHEDAGDPGQCLVQTELLATELDLGLVHDADRGGDTSEWFAHSGGLHHDLFERLRRLLWGLCVDQDGEQVRDHQRNDAAECHRGLVSQNTGPRSRTGPVS